MENKEIKLLDLVFVLFKHRKFFFGNLIIVTCLALVISLLWPKTYKSSVQFFPPPAEKSSFGGLLNNLIQMPMGTTKLSSEAVLIMLNSRSIKEDIINRFELNKVYKENIPEFLLKEFESNIDISEIREGGFGFNPIVAVQLSFSDKDPKRAENITTYYVMKLDSMVKAFNYQRAFNTFETLKKRYLQNIEELEIAEEKFSDFQAKYGLFDIENQLKIQIEKLADLKVKSIELEIQIDVLKKAYSENNQQVQELISQKNAIDKSYNSFLYEGKSKSTEKFFQPLERMPELSKIGLSLYRDVILQGKVFEVIYPQYEQMKTQIESEELGIQILDHAKLPTYKDKPKRAVIVVIGLLFALFSGLLVVYIKEHFNRLESTNYEEYKNWINLKESIIADIRSIRNLWR